MNADPGDLEASGANILFLSGATPNWLATHLSRQSLALLGDDSIFLTLGVFSIVIISCFEEVTSEIIELCIKDDVAYENWGCSQPPEISDGVETYSGEGIDRVNPGEFKLGGERILTGTTQTLFDLHAIQTDESVAMMALEMYALLAVIETRSVGGRFAVIAHDCVDIEAMVTSLTAAETGSDGTPSDQNHLASPEPRDLLLTLNAALSRLSSQALSGTSPIIQTECHFWPHSFLGIGVASLALRNVASFITGTIRSAGYSAAYSAALNAPARWTQEDVTGRTTNLPPYLDQRTESIVRLPGLPDILAEEISIDKEDELIPTPITYYSGRDGFRNDALTMSAPLPSVAGCNSHQWNLGTITHELSHRILSGKIETLLEGFLESIQSASIRGKGQVDVFFAEAPTTVQQQAERLLGFTLAVLSRKDLDATEWDEKLTDPLTFFREAKDRYSVTIEETLVHIFDFYHLCGGNAKTYVDFVWLSWAVQPMIKRRQDEYIKRTLTALAIKNFHAENWRELTIAEFRRLLSSAPLPQRLKMQPEILDILKDKKPYLYYLNTMRHLLALFHLVFKSDKLSTLASAEAYRAPKPASEGRVFNYSATKLIFTRDDPKVPETRFTNPLVFLRDYSQSHNPNAAESAWLLHMLAFNYRPADAGS